MLPPLRPRTAPALARSCFRRSSDRASAAAKLSLQLAVRFWGRSGVVSRVRLASEIRLRRASRDARSIGIPSSCGRLGEKASDSCFPVNAHFRHYPSCQAMRDSEFWKDMHARFTALAAEEDAFLGQRHGTHLRADEKSGGDSP